MLVLVVNLEVVEGKGAELVAVTRELVAGSQAEEGCIEYDLYENKDAPNSFVFIEKWKDEAALEAHTKMEHYVNNIGKIGALLAKPAVVNKFRVAQNTCS